MLLWLKIKTGPFSLGFLSRNGIQITNCIYSYPIKDLQIGVQPLSCVWGRLSTTLMIIRNRKTGDEAGFLVLRQRTSTSVLGLKLCSAQAVWLAQRSAQPWLIFLANNDKWASGYLRPAWALKYALRSCSGPADTDISESFISQSTGLNKNRLFEGRKSNLFFFVFNTPDLEMFTNSVIEKAPFASQRWSPYSLLSFLPPCHLQPVLNSLCT